MATTEEEQVSKHDDFFDDAPAKPTMNGNISPEPQAQQTAAESETTAATEEPIKEGEQDRVTEPQSETAAEPEQKEDHTEDVETEEKKQEGDGVEESNDVPSTNAGVDTAAQENDVQDSQPAEEEEKTSATAQDTDPVEPGQSTEETEQVQEQQQVQIEAGDATDSTAPAPSAEPSEGEIPTTPAPPASRQSEYEEDFSETSGLTSARNTPADSKPGEKKEDEQEEKMEDKKTDKSHSSSSSSSSSSEANTPEPQQVVPQGAELTPRPSTSGGDEGGLEAGGDTVDSRAEAAQVIPVPPPEPHTKKADADGRSSSAGGDEPVDGETFRGEDRTEMIAPEGSEDCRGQGQWKSAEQQAISSAMLVSKSERELTEEAVKERDALRQDHEALKTQLLALEVDVDKKNEQILVDKEILSRKDKEIAELQSELESSQSAMASNEADNSRQKDRAIVKDLQERLAILARENEEKDKRVFKLEEELKEAQTRLRETERRLIHAENNQGQEPPKSKTCVIM